MSLALAQRYAAALAAVSDKPSAETSLESAVDQLRSMVEMLASSSDLRNVLASPSISNAQKRQLVATLGERVTLSRPVRNLLFVMMNNGRMGLLTEVADVTAGLVDERRGVERVEVTSALPLAEDQRHELEQTFGRLRGKRIEAEYSVDEALLGGVVVKAGSTLYDGSLVAQLRLLDRAMAGAV
jgi:F-type H+-transporting ATPase subunit delta